MKRNKHNDAMPRRKWLKIQTGDGRTTGYIEGFYAGEGRYVTIPGASRGIDRAAHATRINDLAMEQALLADAQETPMDADTAAQVNAASLRTESERRQFKHDFRRHVQNIVEANPFYN